MYIYIKMQIIHLNMFRVLVLQEQLRRLLMESLIQLGIQERTEHLDLGDKQEAADRDQHSRINGKLGQEQEGMVHHTQEVLEEAGQVMD